VNFYHFHTFSSSASDELGGYIHGLAVFGCGGQEKMNNDHPVS
jgi:hypothetical protein